MKYVNWVKFYMKTDLSKNIKDRSIDMRKSDSPNVSMCV